MADALSKANLISSCHPNNPEHKGISVFTKKSDSKLKFSDFHGKRFVLHKNESFSRSQFSTIKNQSTNRKTAEWWDKSLQPNMKEVTSAEELVNSLLKAGDKLVVVDFFSPGCGGCRALLAKICQSAETNPEVQFLQVNYEEHKSMCYSLNVHVLPFFRFYRGAHGRLCSFSCTNATIRKFKDALAKHSPDRCSLGPPKGLEEKELLALAANKDLSFTYTPKPVEPVPRRADQGILAEAEPSSSNIEHVAPTALSLTKDSEDKSLVSSGR